MAKWTFDPMHTQVEFSAKHMGLMTVRGHFTDVRVSIDLNEEDFTTSSVELSGSTGMQVPPALSTPK